MPEGTIRLVERSLLPGRLDYIYCRSVDELAEAIHTLKVRGAPAIGVVAAYGLALAAKLSSAHDVYSLLSRLEAAARVLQRTRPTAVNLSWALHTVLETARAAQAGGIQAIKKAVLDQARRIDEENQAANLRMGRYGAELLEDGMNVLTHCNAGPLAACGIGTTLGVIYTAHRQGKRNNNRGGRATPPVRSGDRRQTAESSEPTPNTQRPAPSTHNQMTTIITGSVAYDNIMDFPGHFKDHILPEKIHMLNISFLVDTLKRQRGGVAANIAYTMALLGAPPAVFASVGANDWREYADWMERHGIDTRFVKVVPDEFTATCYITTDRDNNQITGFYTGAMAHDKGRSLTEVPRNELGLVVIGPTEPEPIVSFTRECQQMGVPYVYSPIWQIIRLSAEELAEGLRGAKVVIANDYEYEMIKNKTGLSQRDILDHAEMVVTTKGKHGSTIMTRDEVAAVPPATPKEIVDPVGAGDAYLGGLVYGLEAGMDIERAGRVASLAAVYAIEQYGTQAHNYTRDEFAQRYTENFGEEPVVTEALSATPQAR